MYDYAIIGSGVSGGRIAFELTRAGAKCVLLEAGRFFPKEEFPKDELHASADLYWNGGLELSSDAKLGFLRAKCVGGTSVVSQALLDRFDESVFDDWRNRTQFDFLRPETLTPHYEAVEASLSVHTFDRRDFNRNAELFTKACSSLGYGWEALRRAQTRCRSDEGSDCITCLGGCPRDSKQSTAVTAIRRAILEGLYVLPEFEAQQIVHENHQVRIIGMRRGEATEILASKAVLAAGVLGNVKLLLKSGFGKKLPALGRYFTCHPQVMAYGLCDEPVDAHRGAFQTTKSAEPETRSDGIRLESAFTPPIATAMLMPGFGRKHLKSLRSYRSYMGIEVSIRDEATGSISLTRSGRLWIDKPLTETDRTKVATGQKRAHEVLRQAGATEILDSTQAIGLHLMGGLRLGSHPSTSVVGPNFSVHEHPNLYAADSSVFPAAPGLHPSLTIMALSHRASQEMLTP